MFEKSQRPLIRKQLILNLIAFGVLVNGLILVSSSLVNAVIFRNPSRLSPFTINVSVLIGLSLVYLATLLRRRKRAAWVIVVPLYAFVFGTNITQYVIFFAHNHFSIATLLRNVILPAIVVSALLIYHAEFNVKSDIRNFTLSLRVILLIFIVTLLYGVIGFLNLDKRDFHQEIGLTSAIHHTIDQFDLTTDKQLVPYTRRAKLFLDSLNIISLGAVVYVVISLFQPLRARFSDQAAAREHAKYLLQKYPSNSEDFFKIWPPDKLYFFTPKGTAGLAYHVHHGVAMVAGDPFGQPKSFSLLMDHFLELCRVNDWLPAFIHTEPKNNELYKHFDFSLQKIGEEAILDIDNFQQHVRSSKYFHQIQNKFENHGYHTEILNPLHNDAIIGRLKEVSSDWLELPGRAERGFMMGHFSAAYLQQCSVMVARDAASTIQAFINQVPTYIPGEANYDLLRHSTRSLGNTNDFLLLHFIDYLHKQGYKQLNLGLCPLAGLENRQDDKTVIDSALQFVYANGDRFYSFSGLRRFKAKYEPNWSDRFIAYRGGIRNFTRVLNALNRTMNKTAKS